MQVYAWADAPEYLKSMSENGGDEDWVIVVPNDEHERNAMAIGTLVDRLAVCDYQTIELVGYVVYITCHA